MAGSEKELADLGVISKAQRYLNSALKAHNTMRLLAFLTVRFFEQFELFKQMHAKAAQAVATSDQCVIQYPGRRYKEPEKVWYGTLERADDPVNYDDRKRNIRLGRGCFCRRQMPIKRPVWDTDSFATIDYAEIRRTAATSPA